MLDAAIPLQTGLAGPVVLRRLTAADAAAFAGHVARDGARLREFLGWPAVTDTPEGAAAWLAAYDRHAEGRVVIGGVWHGDELLGGALLFHHDPANAVAEIGCWLVAAGEGHGVAAAACRTLLGCGRQDLGLERVEWFSATRNVRSRRLAERLGFVHEGTLRSAYALRGGRLDLDLLSLVGAELDAAAR